MGDEKTTPQRIDSARRTLGLGERASLTEIKEAYHRLAKKVHPDTGSLSTPEANRRMSEINEAYQVLVSYALSFPLPLTGEEVKTSKPVEDEEFIRRFYENWFL